tara:strand:+ start:2831 stop:4129 length:1299 start_codon:yes stop_codon:yes gene_type:complete
MQKIYRKIYDLKTKHKSSIVFDTRLLKKNDIFIALKNKNNDGNKYYSDAIKKKASLVIVNIKYKHPKLFYVKDSQLFLKNFCKFLIESYKGKIIAITGSVGKTTYKENIYHILKKNNINTYRSYKNYNNILGLQFSILNMNLSSNYSVFELGINSPNEMTKLVKTLQPHYCLVTGIENSHIGNFKNFNHLIQNKLKIFNSQRLIRGLINYNYNPHYINGKINSKVQLINVENIEKNIQKYKNKFKINFKNNKKKYTIESLKGDFYINIAIISYLFIKTLTKKIKLNIYFYNESIIESRGKKLITFIDNKKVCFYDHSYNASPFSLNKQIHIFNQRNIKQKAYILGAMKELGDRSDFFHKQIIELVIKLNLTKIIFVGDEFYKFKNRFKKFIFYKNYIPAIKYLNKEITNLKNIFVMGSRSNQLDRLIKEYVK